MSSRIWRPRALLGALVMAIVLSAVSAMRWGALEDRVVPARSPQPRVSRAPEQAFPHIGLERLQRRDAPPDTDKVAGNTFAAMSWYVPPPAPPPKPAAKPLPPPAPAAPPMPFSFMGRYEDGGTRIILLVKGDRIYTVSEGEVIDKIYRVERLGGGQLELTYLPLDIKQTISAGET
jgi:hypothetical protein